MTKTLSFTVPATLPAGYYQPYLAFFFQGVPAENSSTIVNVDPAFRRNHYVTTPLPLIRVGSPSSPRLFAALFADAWTQGTLGVRATEDRQRYGIASHVAVQTDTVVLPRFDATRAPIRYRLEPHLPMVSVSDRGAPASPPRIALRFPSGSLTVRITKPDGSTSTIGPAPFVQSRIISPAKASGESFDRGSRHLEDVYQISTMDPRFEIAFEQYGRHRIVLDGSIDDIWGTRWQISGTYEVIVAEPLVLDTAVLPGTPLQAGNRLAFALQMPEQKPVPIPTRRRTAR